ncbi:Holliday junction resolvase RuvX [Chloroflexota bacterium]
MARILGLDVGDRWIGVALSDPEGILATPLTIIDLNEEKTDMAAIIDIVNEKQVGRIIVGLPCLMDGSVGQQAEKVIAFARELGNHTDVPVDFRDETLSTVSAKRLMQGGRKKSGNRRDDAIAAALVLQDYLEERIS